MTSEPARLRQIWLIADVVIVLFTFDDWHDGTLLDSGRALEAISVDTCALISLNSLDLYILGPHTSQELALQVHRIE